MWKKLNAHKRLPTALALIAAVVALIHWAPFWLLAAVMQILVLGALLEFYGLARKKRTVPFVPAGIVCAFVLSLPFISYEVPMGAALLAALAAAGFMYLVRMNSLERVMVLPRSLGVTFFGAVYLGFTLNHFLPLRRDFGPWAVYFLLAVISAGDTGAFLVGSLLGRHRMSPLASPKKTWEGAVGGLVFAASAAVAARELFFPQLSLMRAAVYGLALHAVAQISDLVESLFKRAAGVKDSGNIFPGHGGVLDRVDSLILAAPVYYYLLLYRP